MALTSADIPSHPDAVAELQRCVDALLAERTGLRVLDAGCGPRLNVTFPDGAWVMGVDEDECALARNQAVHEAVVADLATWEPPPDSFDAIVSWYVLEHLDRPDQVLARFAGAARPGGLVVLAVPNLRSPKSLLAKFTPHRFHVWFRRRVLGRPRAGTPGHGPYPTTLRLSIDPGRLIRRAARLGLTVVHIGWYEDSKQQQLRHRFRLTGVAWRVVRGIVKVGSFGLLDAARTELLLVLRRHDRA